MQGTTFCKKWSPAPLHKNSYVLREILCGSVLVTT